MNHETLALQAYQLDEYAKKYPSDAMREAAKKAASLLNQYGTANQTQQALIAQEVTDLVATAERVTSVQATKTSMALKEKFGIAALIAIAAFIVGFIAWYIRSRGIENLSSLESIRPVLVFTLIISTITFGGALVFGALYSEGETLEVRFRHAREIFLVFSGIFGTVIGFYFGAGESKGLQQQQALDVIADMVETTLKGHVIGGTPPYKVTLTYGSQTLPYTLQSSADSFKHEFDKTKDDIQALKIEVADSKDQKSTWSKGFPPEQLKAAGWAKYQNALVAPGKEGMPDKKAESKPRTEPGVPADKPAVPSSPTAPVGVQKKP